jgi:hypothetical protein
MPVAQSRGHAGKALVIAAAAIVLILVVTVFLAMAASRGDVEINLGDDRFEVGDAKEIIELIDEGDGLPALFPDLVSRDRNIFVQHTGTAAEEGWVAFGAFDPDDPRCAVEIDRETTTLVNACDRDITYPLDGEGLRFYPTSVEDGDVIVDINEISTTTTAAGS